MTLNEYQLKPTLDADGKPWIQRCYVCDKPINFKKSMPGVEHLKVGDLVRHKKCYPTPIK